METAAAHKNNFDFLRFLFASFVIFTHCYAFLTGKIVEDPVYILTHRVLSDYAVCGFFVLSGFLIRQSLSRSISLSDFFKKRALRIVPGLWVAVLFTVFVIGTTTSTLPVQQYLTSSGTWKYLFANAVLYPQRYLPGLFEHNIETAVNGSLWTLRYEVLFYVLLSLLFFFPKKIKSISFTVLILCLVANSILKNEWVLAPSSIVRFFELAVYFCSGACVSLYLNVVKKHKSVLLLIASILFFASVLIFKEKLETLNVLTFSVMVLCFGLHYFRPLHFSQYTGDISYGTYIYAYPVQQALMVWLHPANIVSLLVPSLLLSWLLGWLSWHSVEKRFLKRKQKASA